MEDAAPTRQKLPTRKTSQQTEGAATLDRNIALDVQHAQQEFDIEIRRKTDEIRKECQEKIEGNAGLLKAVHLTKIKMEQAMAG